MNADYLNSAKAEIVVQGSKVEQFDRSRSLWQRLVPNKEGRYRIQTAAGDGILCRFE